MLTKNSNAGVNVAFQCIHIVITMTTIELQWLNKHMNTSSTTTKKKTKSHKKHEYKHVSFLNISLHTMYRFLIFAYRDIITFQPVTIRTSNNQQQIITYTNYNTNQQQPAADYIHQLQYEPATTSNRLHTPVTIRTSNNQQQITYTSYNTNQQHPAADYIHLLNLSV